MIGSRSSRGISLGVLWSDEAKNLHQVNRPIDVLTIATRVLNKPCIVV